MLSGFLRYDQLLTFLSSRNVNDNEVHYLGLLYFNFGCANIEIDIKLWNFEWVKCERDIIEQVLKKAHV